MTAPTMRPVSPTPGSPPGSTPNTSRPSGRPPASDVPVTSTERPWDRVRFSGDPRSRGLDDPSANDLHARPPAIEPLTENLPALIVRHSVEALLGVRPAAQLSRWMSPALYEALSRRAGLATRLQGRQTRARHVQVRSVRLSEPAAGCTEATLVLYDGERVRACALRMEAFRGRWRATALEIG